MGVALRAKAAVQAKATVEMGRLGTKTLTRGRGRGVDWGRSCEGVDGRRLQGHSDEVHELAECEGMMCKMGRFGYGGWIRWTRSAGCEAIGVNMKKGTKEVAMLMVFMPWRCGGVRSAGIGLGGVRVGCEHWRTAAGAEWPH